MPRLNYSFKSRVSRFVVITTRCRAIKLSVNCGVTIVKNEVFHTSVRQFLAWLAE